MGYMTDERRMIQETARAFAMKEVLPLANKLDPEKGDIPRELIQKLADMGYFGIVIPEQYGELGLGVFEYCLITEELARAWMSVASIIARGNGLSAGRGMTDAQRAVFLPRAARGEFLGAAAMSEPDVGSDLGNISCRARKDGDSWVINGNKYWCTFADGADYIMLVARTSDSPDPKRKHVGLSSFLIEKPRGTLPPGVKGAPIPKIGYFGWKTWELAFDNCRLPGEALIGEEGRAFYYISAGLERARAHTAARAIGRMLVSSLQLGITAICCAGTPCAAMRSAMRSPIAILSRACRSDALRQRRSNRPKGPRIAPTPSSAATSG